LSQLFFRQGNPIFLPSITIKSGSTLRVIKIYRPEINCIAGFNN
jgi:hypothetical protein